MRRWFRHILLASALTLCVGVASYCSVQAPRTALSPAPPGAPLESLASQPLADAEPGIDLPLSRLGLLLAEPQLEKVAHALEARDFEQAAAELSALIQAHAPATEVSYRYQMLLARLQEQAGQAEAALASFEQVLKSPSPLATYAELGRARVLLLLGRAPLALAALQSLPDSGPARAQRLGLLAEAAKKAQNAELAETSYRQIIAETSVKSGPRLEARLNLAELWIDRSAAASNQDENLTSALGLLREALLTTNLSKVQVKRIQELRLRALALTSPEARKRQSEPTFEEQLVELRALVDAHRNEEALEVADRLHALGAKPPTPAVCEAEFLRGKAHLALRQASVALGEFEAWLETCPKETEIYPKVRFFAGKAALGIDQATRAIAHFEALEHDAPKNSLADDARYQAALAYLDLGVEARFTANLSSIAADYPEGDMAPEGLFRLALRRLEKLDYPGALHVLEQALSLAKTDDAAKDRDLAGRERYFYARALELTGSQALAKVQYETLVSELPFAYYMLLAYTRLSLLDRTSAESSRKSAATRAEAEPLRIRWRPEFGSADFQRAVELLGVGDFEAGAEELSALTIADERAKPELTWAIAEIHARAGATTLALQLARSRQRDLLSHFPAGTWLSVWKLAFPQPYHATVAREALRNHVSEALIYAIMREESAFNPDAASLAQAYGLMQLIVPTAKMFAKPLGLPADRQSLRRPAINIALGARALSKFSERFPNNPLLAIPAYNAGPENPKRWQRERPESDFDVWVESIPFLETRRYVKRVLASRAAYSYLYAKSFDPADLTLPIKVSGG